MRKQASEKKTLTEGERQVAERERVVKTYEPLGRFKGCQRCGGGYRIIRKKIRGE